jgi:Zn ribbon nucleic-acid-binding protein
MSWHKESERHQLASRGVRTKKNKQKPIANNITCPKCHKDNCIVTTEGNLVTVRCHDCGYGDSQLLEKDVFTCHGKKRKDGQMIYRFSELNKIAKKQVLKNIKHLLPSEQVEITEDGWFFEDGTEEY